MTLNAYEELGLKKTCTTQEIKIAYRKLALKYHPDKQVNKSQDEIKQSTEQFQRLTMVYETLVDPSKRSIYDTTGKLGDEIICGEENWGELFEQLFTRLTEQKIIEFEKVYKYSNQERQDVLKAYHDTKGNLLNMIDIVPLSTYDDIERFKSIVQDAIEQGEVQIFKQFPKINQKELKKRKALAKREEEIVKESKAKKESKTEGLEVELKKRNEERLQNLINKLEGDGKKGKKRKEPTDEEFEALQKKLFK